MAQYSYNTQVFNQPSAPVRRKVRKTKSIPYPIAIPEEIYIAIRSLATSRLIDNEPSNPYNKGSEPFVREVTVNGVSRRFVYYTADLLKDFFRWTNTQALWRADKLCVRTSKAKNGLGALHSKRDEAVTCYQTPANHDINRFCGNDDNLRGVIIYSAKVIEAFLIKPSDPSLGLRMPSDVYPGEMVLHEVLSTPANICKADRLEHMAYSKQAINAEHLPVWNTFYSCEKSRLRYLIDDSGNYKPNDRNLAALSPENKEQYNTIALNKLYNTVVNGIPSTVSQYLRDHNPNSNVGSYPMSDRAIVNPAVAFFQEAKASQMGARDPTKVTQIDVDRETIREYKNFTGYSLGKQSKDQLAVRRRDLAWMINMRNDPKTNHTRFTHNTALDQADIQASQSPTYIGTQQPYQSAYQQTLPQSTSLPPSSNTTMSNYQMLLQQQNQQSYQDQSQAVTQSQVQLQETQGSAHMQQRPQPNNLYAPTVSTINPTQVAADMHRSLANIAIAPQSKVTSSIPNFTPVDYSSSASIISNAKEGLSEIIDENSNTVMDEDIYDGLDDEDDEEGEDFGGD